MPSQKQSKFKFPWTQVRDAFSGKSVLDTRYSSSRTLEEADQTLTSYGYSWDSEADRTFLLNTFKKAIEFIETQFVEPFEDPLKIPEEVRLCPDLRLLLQWSNLRARNKELQLWACATLKVMHTILHLENDFLADYFQEARAQIFQRFNGHLYIDENNKIYLGKERDEFIPLYFFEVKREKDWNSKVLKLLHKPESTAARIYDHIGVRVVTESLMDLLLVFNYLLSSKIFIFANVSSLRTRNSLLDLFQCQKHVTRNLRRFSENNMSPEELEHEIQTGFEREDLIAKADEHENPFSLEGFRSVQFTCRHLVRFANPTHSRLYDLRQHLFVERSPVHTIDELDAILAKTKREIQFFFPFEIQLMDRETFMENQMGLGSHAEYKQGQLQKARKRVLGKLLDRRET